jgi:hypothetical protein
VVSPGSPDDGAVGDDGDDRRRALVVLAVVFVLVAVGAWSVAFGPFASGDRSGGTGELTVAVESQDGESVAGEEVAVMNPETGEVVASGTTKEDGRVSFTLPQSEYTIAVGDKTTDADLDDESTTIGLDVTVAPPDPDRSPAAVRATSSPCATPPAK